MEDQSEDNPNVKTWKILTFFFIVVSICLGIGLIIALTNNANDTDDLPKCGTESIPLCGKTKNSFSRTIDLSEPNNPGPFHDLTKNEMKNIWTFLQNQLPKAVIYQMDLLPAKKSDVLAFLKNRGQEPERHARVYLVIKDLKPIVISELDCWPLPKVSNCTPLKSDKRRNPVEWAFSGIFGGDEEFIQMLEKSNDSKACLEKLHPILLESYGASLINCTPWDSDSVITDCLKMYDSPVASNIHGDNSALKYWNSIAYLTDYYGEYYIDFGFLMEFNVENLNIVYIKHIWYNDQLFQTCDDFVSQYNIGSINKTKITPPKYDHPRESFSSLYQRGDPLPETPQRPPTLVEPDGKRYSLKNREVEYLGWKFNFRMSPISGPVLNNIRFKGDLIAYELSLQEIAVFYSANNPMQRLTDYVDSQELYGTESRSLIPGADCPEIATFVNQTFYGYGEHKRAICLFENNNGYPLRRHLSYLEEEGYFYGGMMDSALTMRTIMTVVNYDYVVDFIFHQTGTIQTRVMSTGYIFSSYYSDAEAPYGFRVEKNLVAVLHHHVFHFKVDLDISGTSNRYETLDIKPDKVRLRKPYEQDYYQTRFERTLYKSEQEAVYDFNFDHPKIHVVHNAANKTEYGEIKAYRITLNGMSKQLIPEEKNSEAVISWARHQMVVTKQKDDELLSSSPYAMMDSLNPTVNFTSFYADDDNIVDEDLVFWISCGIHHLPHTEDLPITPTDAHHLQFFLSPYNYFKQCPSVASRDHIRIQLKKDGVAFDRNGYEDEQCTTHQLADEYEKLVKEDPNIIFDYDD